VTQGISRVAEQIIERWEKRAKPLRMNYDNLWDEIAEVMYPGRIGFNRKLTEGETRTNHIVNSAAARASRKFGTVLEGAITPRSENWVDVKTTDRNLNEKREVRAWFDIVNEQIWNTIYNPRTGWEMSAGESYRDTGTFGASCLFNATRRSDQSLLFNAIPLKDVWIETNAYGEVSIFYVGREFHVYQAMQMFNPNSLSLSTQKKIRDNKLNDKIKFLHHVFENEDRVEGKKDKNNKAWKSFWIETEEKHVVEEGGFSYKPYIYPRLETVVGEIYPWSPGRLALPDALMLQAQQRSVLTAAHFNTQPPLMVPDNGFFDIQQYAPGEIIPYDMNALQQMGGSQFPVQPLNTGHNSAIGQDMVDATKQDIWQNFMLDLMTLPDRANMTATEILRRNADFAREVGPSFFRLADQYPAAIVDTVFNRQLEQSMMLGFGDGSPYPPPPEDLDGAETKVNIKAPIQELQEQVALSSSISSMSENLAPVIELDQNARHQLNTMEVAREVIRVFGKASFLADEEEAAGAIQAEQEAAQRQQQLMEGGAEAEILDKLGKADQSMANAEATAV